MATLTVGSGQQFSTISAAVAASHDGDVVQVQAGTYTNDFATINTKITLQGVGGMVHMVATQPIPNDKGILVTNTDVTIDHFEFSGATGPSGNDAGIRYQGGNLTLTNDYFHDNQNGLLANNTGGVGTISISNSEFSHNGAGDGYTHNIYVGEIGKVTIDNSYFHDAVVGHEIKSRADETVITNSRIADNAGNSSYSIDLPNGGKATISGNVIEQGANGGNPNIIAYGEEGGLHSGSSLSITNNTVLNDMVGKGTLLWDASGTSASVSGNKVWGLSDSQMVSGSGASVSSTTHLTSEPALDSSHPWSTSTTGSGSTSTGGTTGGTTDTTGTTGGTTSGTSGSTSTAGITWSGGSGGDNKTGTSGDDYLSGYGGKDKLSGAAGHDTLDGGASNDTLTGGAGDDKLIGGGGNDVFRFTSGGGHDTVQGFASHTYTGGEHDHFDLSGLGIHSTQFASAVQIVDTTAGAQITAGDMSMTVLGMHASSFNSSDFLFA
jgi:Ca2+-binding RTX toxin-like protein